MPVPLVLLAVSGVSALGTAAISSGYARAFLKRQLTLHQSEIEAWALSAVAEQLGLPDLMDEHIDRHSFTRAVNSAFLSGSDFQFTNLFDAGSVKDDALKMGLKQAADQLGLSIENVSVKGLSDALREWVLKLVEEEITADEAGELIQDAADIYEVIQLYRKYKKAETDGEAAEDSGRKPLINTPEAAANRERQARYRAKHRRQWVAN